jgi:hypothetical protein
MFPRVEPVMRTHELNRRFSFPFEQYLQTRPHVPGVPFLVLRKAIG